MFRLTSYKLDYKLVKGYTTSTNEYNLCSGTVPCYFKQKTRLGEVECVVLFKPNFQQRIILLRYEYVVP